MVLKFRQRIFDYQKECKGRFHYFVSGEQRGGYVRQLLDNDESLFDFDIYWGLKDKKGLEVYTNDVLKVIEENCAGESFVGFYKVFFDENNNCFKLEVIKSGILVEGANIYIPHSKELEKIGTIYDYKFK